MGGNVLASNVLGDRPDFKAIIKPIVNFTHVIEKPKNAELVNNFLIAVTYFNTYVRVKANLKTVFNNFH